MTKPSIEPLKIGIKAIQEQEEKERNWEKTFNEMLDGRFICCASQSVCTALLKVLEYIYRDEEEQIISWWMYEKDYGKKKDFHIYDNGGVIPTDTIEDLYDYLIKYHFKDEDETDEIRINKKMDVIHDYDLCEMFMDFVRSIGYSEENVLKYFRE